MTTEDILLLDSPELRRIVEDNIDREPSSIALDSRIPHTALVATQVKYLQRARRKLPSYYEARAIIPPLAFEQSSSEAAAAHKRWSGELGIDLTCGLGADSLYLSRNFRRVISVELSPVLAQAARINFRRLGAENIEVTESSAEDFMESFAASGLHADLIYADPDRRGSDGRKLFRLEDCRPDIIGLLPLMRRSSSLSAVKMSPLFDVDEAFGVFGDNCIVQAISLGGECKEVLAQTGNGIAGRTVAAAAIGMGEARYPFVPHLNDNVSIFTPPYRYMVIPDVSLRKARLTGRYAADTLPGSFTVPGDGYIFTDTRPPAATLGKVFEVADMKRYKPEALKKELRGRGIVEAEIHTHAFPHSPSQTAARIGIREGGRTQLAFMGTGGEFWVIELKRITL